MCVHLFFMQTSNSLINENNVLIHFVANGLFLKWRWAQYLSRLGVQQIY